MVKPSNESTIPDSRIPTPEISEIQIPAFYQHKLQFEICRAMLADGSASLASTVS